MFCKNCGTQLKDGATFCTECGWKVNNVGAQAGGNKAMVPPPNVPGANAGNSNMAGTNMPNPNIPGQNMGAPDMRGPQSAGPVGNMPQRNMNPGNAPVKNTRQMNTNQRPVAAPAKKKGHTVAIVLAAVFGTIVLGFILLVVIGLNASDPEASNTADGNDTTVSGADLSRSGGELNPEAIDQLLAILQETENTTLTLADELGDTDDIKAIIEVSNKWYEDVEAQYRKSQEIEGLPGNVRKAAGDMYEMYLSAIEFMNRDFTFEEDIVELGNITLGEDYVQVYYDYKEKHESVVCPENMADSWNALGKSIEMYGTFVDRVNEGKELDDPLRVCSALNLLIRFSSVFENEADNILSITEKETAFVLEQIEKVGSIMTEIEQAATLSSEEIGQYEFKYEVDGVIPDPTYDHIANIYPSLYNTYDSFLTVNIGCLHGSRDIIVECEIPGLSQSTAQSYHIGSALTVLNIKPPASSEKLNLDTAKDTQIKVTIKDKSDGSVIDAQSFPVHIFSRNDFAWYSDEFGTITQDNILCFLAPDSEAVTELKRNAIDILAEMSGGELNMLAGYQTPAFLNDSNGDGYADNLEQAEFVTTFLQAAALMRSMSDMGVRYTNDTFSIDQAGQHILFPDQVLERKTGLCIETSLVIASALQSMGMHTCLVFPLGHAQVAVEAWEGSGSYFLIETTALPNENSVFVDDANAILSGWETEFDDYPIAFYTKKQWTEYIDQDPEDTSDDCYVLDCGDGALLGLTPFAY